MNSNGKHIIIGIVSMGLLVTNEASQFIPPKHYAGAVHSSEQSYEAHLTFGIPSSVSGTTIATMTTRSRVSIEYKD